MDHVPRVGAGVVRWDVGRGVVRSVLLCEWSPVAALLFFLAALALVWFVFIYLLGESWAIQRKRR